MLAAMTDHAASAAPYVTNHAWLRMLSRADAIDDVADTFERRPDPAPAAAVPDEIPSLRDEPITRWPRHSRGWRSAARLHPSVREPA